jgi:maltooligosyltrehalose trehalohydrolase
MDGLRLDAIHAIYDMGPHQILRAIKEAADEVATRVGRHVHVIAESNLNDVRLLRPAEVGGCGLDAQWHDDFHHAVHAHLTGERQGYYVDFGAASDFPKLLEKTFLQDGGFSRFHGRRHGAPVGDLPGDCFVICIQNHDQVGNRAAGDRLSTLLEPPALRLAASLLLLAPHLPLLFMGEEYGEKRPFPFFCSFGDRELIKNVRDGRRQEFAEFAWQGEVPDPQAEATFAGAVLSWSWPEGSMQAGLRRLYRDLLHARRLWPALADFRNRSARLLPGTRDGVLEMVRGSEPPGALRMLFNLTDKSQALVSPTMPEQLLFWSEAKQYGGIRRDEEFPHELRPFECVVFGRPSPLSREGGRG